LAARRYRKRICLLLNSLFPLIYFRLSFCHKMFGMCFDEYFFYIRSYLSLQILGLTYYFACVGAKSTFTALDKVKAVFDLRKSVLA